MISKKTTSDLMAEVIRWLNVKLAPMISIHGVLVDVFGEGVLIMGDERNRKERSGAGADPREAIVWSATTWWKSSGSATTR